MVWPTLGSRKAKEQNRTEHCPYTAVYSSFCTVVYTIVYTAVYGP